MSCSILPFQSSLIGMLGQSGLSDDELATLRRRAWTEQGLLIVSLCDRKLTQNEASLLRAIAERLYEGDLS